MSRLHRVRPYLSFLLVTTVLLSLSLCVLNGCGQHSSQEQKKQETLRDRVLRTGVIRCAYIAYPPYCIKDPNTGKMSGIFVEAMDAIGKKLGVKIEWVEEVGWGTVFEGFDDGRYDVLGSGLWENSTRAKAGYFSVPLFYNAIRVWIRSDEKRFKSLEDLNSSNVRIAVQDGAMEDIIARNEFPNAKRISIPQGNPWSDNLLNIISGKADVTFAELGVIVPFLKKNPGTLKELKVGHPIRIFANSYPFKMGENEFKSMIDAAIFELINDGTIDNILKKYEDAPGEYLRVALPYQPASVGN